ncbi:MAG TPA: 23S rRNA (guanine(2445)-N(2))/(guanine(2069)-N(7))-methyltransferase, partial [Thermoanaerobaculia bacterium]|nr:23S rRNA (guanine(2445)-N(2))/(guanine(2069)-N(7))-methyltransferase [Thermoanaerobaculia bacterium]
MPQLTDSKLSLVATCASGLEEILEGELAALGVEELSRGRGAVTFSGSWTDCWRANWRLRTANRVLVELGSWMAPDGPALAAGARRLMAGTAEPAAPAESPVLDLSSLLHPDLTFAIQATAAGSQIRDARWAALKVKDGLVDGQRDLWGRRSDVEREVPDVALRLRLAGDEASLLLDTSGEPLDRRGYREIGSAAPLREQLAAACVLASGWDGTGPVVDPMCGSGTLLIEAGWFATGRAPGCLRDRWAFERLPGFDPDAFDAIRREPIPAPGPEVQLIGSDLLPEATRAARTNLTRAGLDGHAKVRRGAAIEVEPPPGPGLVAVNPPHGERMDDDPALWRMLGDLLKQRFRGWRAVVLAGGVSRGKWIGLKPRRRIPVMNGPLEARILLFDLF